MLNLKDYNSYMSKKYPRYFETQDGVLVKLDIDSKTEEVFTDPPVAFGKVIEGREITEEEFNKGK